MPESSTAASAASQQINAEPLYAAVEPYLADWIEVGNGHRIYFEQCGAASGMPLLVLHGGPGSGASPMQRRLFNPAKYRIVIFDQRGCGRSTPRGEIEANSTTELIEDIERLRRHLGIERWLVFGGSWGASLALAYAGAHRAHCLAVLLRGAFLTGRADLDWFFAGAGALLPQAWRALLQSLGLGELDADDPASGQAVQQRLQQRVFDADPRVASLAAAAWARWEDAVSSPGADSPQAATDMSIRPELIDKYRVQAHYLAHQCFLGEAVLLDTASRLRGLPVRMIHGRLDWVCRPRNAWELARRIDGAAVIWVDSGAHNPYHRPMLTALAQATAEIEAMLEPKRDPP